MNSDKHLNPPLSKTLCPITEGMLWVVLPWWATQFVDSESLGFSFLPFLLHGLGSLVIDPLPKGGRS